MIEPASSEGFSFALFNAALLALWPVFPALLFGYLRQSAALRDVPVEFSLRPSEIRELDRAIRLYREARCRLKTLERTGTALGFWPNLFLAKKPVRPADEAFLDLQAHAEILRETIVRLQRRPLQRLKSWMRLYSSKAALSRAVAAHLIGFILLVAVFHVPSQTAWAGDLTTSARDRLGWYPFDGRLFYANAVAAAFAAGAAFVFYASQWTMLRRDYGCEFCSFNQLARGDPDHTIDQADSGQTGAAERACAALEEADSGWWTVLELSPSATIDDVKEAYKRLIKQNHPDRVHGLSPAFQRLAEAETQKLNAALGQALRAVAATSD